MNASRHKHGISIQNTLEALKHIANSKQLPTNWNLKVKQLVLWTLHQTCFRYKTLIVGLHQTSLPSPNCPSVYRLNPSCLPTLYCPPKKLECASPFSTDFLAFFFFSFVFLLIFRSFWVTPIPLVPLLLSSSLLFVLNFVNKYWLNWR